MRSSNNSIYKVYKDLFVPLENPGPFVVHSGNGCYFKDYNGRKYLDLSGGIAALPFGYGFKPTQEIIRKQAKKLIHCGSEFVNEESIRLIDTLNKILPGYSYFLSNSGAEANEAALKLARLFCSEAGRPSKKNLIAFKNSFHGRTLLNISLSGNKAHTRGYEPLVEGVRQVEFNNVQELGEAVNSDTAAIVLEVVQGSVGTSISPQMVNEMHRLRDLYGCLIIVDDIQTGVGRLGTFFGFTKFGLNPDIVTMAKGIGGGLPIGVTMSRQDISKCFVVGTHGTTFGGNPVVCAAASDIVKRVNSKKLLSHVRKMGDLLRLELEMLGEKYGCFLSVRGHGLILAAELAPPFRGFSQDIKREAERNGLIIRTSGKDVIRATPPLNISSAVVADAIKRLDRSLMNTKKLISRSVRI